MNLHLSATIMPDEAELDALFALLKSIIQHHAGEGAVNCMEAVTMTLTRETDDDSVVIEVGFNDGYAIVLANQTSVEPH